jgi:hypothetical protein
MRVGFSYLRAQCPRLTCSWSWKQSSSTPAPTRCRAPSGAWEGRSTAAAGAGQSLQLEKRLRRRNYTDHSLQYKGGTELPLPALRRQAPRWARGRVGGTRAPGSGSLPGTPGPRSRSSKRNPITCLGPPSALRSSFASSSTPAGCFLQLEHGHGLDEAARGAKSGCKK